MTYIVEPPTGDTTPGIHILLIGVDRYEYLHEEDGTHRELGAGFSVLDAPTHSCKLLGEWFANGNLRNRGFTVKSVDVLASRAAGAADVTTTDYEQPTFGNVRKAIERWYKLGQLSPDNLLVFYFCGHGMRHSEGNHSLLCSDFGAHDLAPFDHAIHYEGLERGMRTCAANRQLFLLDTCRAPLPAFTNNFTEFGNAIVARRAPDDLGAVSQSVLWATAGGAQAWVLYGAPSVFATTFIQSMKGGAAIYDARSEGMVATASSIQYAMAQYLAVVTGVDQEPESGQPVGKTFTLHKFGDDFSIPVVVRCDPDEYSAGASLSCQDASGIDVKTRQPYATEPDHRWILDLSPGSYTFHAACNLSTPCQGTVTKDARPPIAVVRIPME
ncbi:caspase family protein [Paraburkholderia azotifigens]|nr:caspase family protein [Paraburkholderia azotifigens]